MTIMISDLGNCRAKIIPPKDIHLPVNGTTCLIPKSGFWTYDSGHLYRMMRKIAAHVNNDLNEECLFAIE